MFYNLICFNFKRYRYWSQLSKSLQKQFESLDPKYTKPYFRTMLILYFTSVGFIFILAVLIQSLICFFQSCSANWVALSLPILWIIMLIYIIIMIWISRRVLKRYGGTKPKKIEPTPEETETLEKKIKEENRPNIQIYSQ